MRWLAGTLLALLALAYATVSLASPNTKVRPAPDDAGLGGLSRFAQALRESGRRVAFDASSRPKLVAGDVAIVPLLGARRIPEPVVRFVASGGRAFVLGVPSALQPVGAPTAVEGPGEASAKIDPTEIVSFEEPDEQLDDAGVWQGDDYDAALLSQVGKGRIAGLQAGALATNRFLGRADNARVVFSTLDTLGARPTDRLVFLALGYGEQEDLGPVEAIGPWAVGALWQTLAVLAAFGIARGVRFGLSAPDAASRRGARELLDALAGHYRRGRRTDAPLRAAARERPNDPEVRALAARPKVAEAEARRALADLEAKPEDRGS